MIDLIDGVKAGGCGRILVKHLLRLIYALICAVVLTGLVRFLLGKEEVVPINAEFAGALVALVLVLVIDFLRAVIKNGEKSGHSNAT
ncbi:hypothetical protein [Microbulbifer sp. SAOS-129_SWC]|uniref:hypothetical protein n=1 Tax=Microbulbifer sp. SAOS-129_SWC TaxID=3145235 RepID=UPI003217FBFC